LSVLNILFVGSDEVARSIAKKSDSRDVDNYIYKDLKEDSSFSTISIIRPINYPDKPKPFFASLTVSDFGIIEINKIDAAFGEAIVSMACAGIKDGFVIVNPTEGEWVDDSQVKTLLQQAGLSNWKFIENEGIIIREKLITILNKIKPQDEPGFVVAVDQAFTVKGVGLVAIGHVQSGTLNKHSEVIFAGSEGSAVARSLQVMDLDVDVANVGDRVGLALRTGGSFRDDLLGRGSILADTTDRFEIQKKSNFKIEKAAFQKHDLVDGDVIHLCADFQFIVGRVVNVGNVIDVEWDSPIVINKSSKRNPLIVQLEANPRIMGFAKFK
jgi:selenocysteine-specific translation elongation factor